MKNTGIYTRLLLILVLIGTISLFIMSTIYFIANKQEKLMSDASRVQFSTEVNSLVKMKTATLNQVVYDYTYWDDFVENIDSNDSVWYENNITSILKSFRLDYVCVYDTSFNLVHEAVANGFTLRGLISKEVLVKVKDARFLDFFQETPDGAVQISSATIHPDSDPSHTHTKPSGYLILAKSWDKRFLGELSMLSSSDIVFSHPGDSVAKRTDFTDSVIQPLAGWNGKNVGHFVFSRTSNSLKHFHDLKGSMLLVLLLALLVTGFILSFSFRRWVVKPLKLVTTILETSGPAQITQLQQSPGEFREIGNLFGDFFRQKDELKLAKEKAEESDKLKTAFLTNISHEIRTPMNGILGFAELLRTPGLTGIEQLEYLGIIEISCDRMLNIINDIIDISKIEAGLISVNNFTSDINHQTDYILTFFKPEAESKGLSISCKNGLLANQAIVDADHEKIYAILTNLVKNAIKFTDSGSIEFGYVLTGSTTAAANELQFYVKDTGIGIPANRQQAVFDRFIQADIADTRAFQGAGLGLSISNAYAKMLGGKIWVESEEGKGSTFYFTLPYNPVSNVEIAAPKAVRIKEVENKVRKLTILVVEDDDTSALLINLILRDFSREILKAKSGNVAVETCRNNPNLDLILMDIKIPDLNGYESTRQIRKFNKNVVIIAQTAFAMVREKEQALEAGCNDYISKPISVELLRGLVEKHFAK
ncbi:MAG: ATP-binding protein [Bacteroidota bacterium]